MATWYRLGEHIIDTGFDDVPVVGTRGYGYAAKVRVSVMSRSFVGSVPPVAYRAAATAKVMFSTDFAFGTGSPVSVTNSNPGRLYIHVEVWVNRAEDVGDPFTVTQLAWDLIRLN